MYCNWNGNKTSSNDSPEHRWRLPVEFPGLWSLDCNFHDWNCAYDSRKSFILFPDFIKRYEHSIAFIILGIGFITGAMFGIIGGRKNEQKRD